MVMPKALVFIACSIDGFIARTDGALDWLLGHPAPEGEDFGYAEFIGRIDALMMGRATYEAALGFDPWPYAQPVHVLSRTLRDADVPHRLHGSVRITAESPRAVLEALGRAGAQRVYVDGGQVIRACLREKLIQRMTITRIPVLLGEGIPLFGGTGQIALEHEATRDWPNGFVQSDYRVL